jgi:EmrB/QacA subfamily drug resistance transporter
MSKPHPTALADRAARPVTPTAPPAAAPPAATPPAVPHRLALPVLLAGVALLVLDFFIVNVALPAIQTDLHAGPTALEWVVAGYGLTLAAFLVAAGRIGDQFGRRRMFTAGVGLFTAASAACGLAPTAAVLVAARLAQGTGAAMISPTVLAIIGVTYAGAARARAVSMYATTMGVAAVSGQLLGGLLLQADLAGLGWRLVFLVNLPVGVAALAAAGRCVPESRAAQPAPLDVPGLALLTAGLTALLLPLVDGRDRGWPWWAFASLAAAPACVAAFAVRQRTLSARGAAPLLDPALFRARTFTAGMLTQLTFWAGQASYFLVLALYLQLGRGLSALQSGLVFTILAGAYLVASMRAPALVVRYGRTVVVAGALTLAAGHLLALAAAADAGTGPVLLLAPGLLLAGTGMGLCIGPITSTVLGHADPQRAGAVSGALSTVQQVGNALGVALVGLVFFGAADTGYRAAFTDSLAVLAVLLVAVAGCARLLPGSGRPVTRR